MRQPKQYHVGFLRQGDTLVVQMRENLDCLSPELWRYFGLREITKAAVYANRKKLLDAVNQEEQTAFTHIQVA